MNPAFADRCGFARRRLSSPIPVFNVDGTPNENGMIREVVELVLRFRDHTERALFAVTNIGRQDIILGYTWLRQHNPEIDWVTKEVSMSRCPSICSTCRVEVGRERRVRKRGSRLLRSCRMGPIPLVEELHSDSLPVLLETEEADEEEDESAEGETSPEDYDPLEGDRIFCAVPPPTPEYARSIRAEQIRATETISQRLASAFQKNKPPDPRNASLPANFFEEFDAVFSKESFDSLPEHRLWDHAIEIIPDAKIPNRKLYPLSLEEQAQLDAFLEENLTSGRIRPSKSPIAAPFFFVKKKDGSLRPVQDYRALNTATVKNRYPLPLIDDLVNKLQGARYFTKLDI